MAATPLVRGVILAGGQASRFGGSLKGLERVGGRRILDLQVEAHQAAFGHLPLLIANHPDAASWYPGLEVVADLRPGLGSLGGLYTAVIAGPAPVVITGWDMPFVQTGLLTRLAAGLIDADACLPSSGGPRGLEPMCAAYGPGCGPAMAESLDRGELQAVAFHPRCRISILSRDVVADVWRSLPALLQREHGSRPPAGGCAVADTRILSIVGRAGAGKTTLAVALASEYVRKGRRVMAIKHAGLVPGLDRVESDGQRLFNEGKAERVIVSTPGARVITERRDEDTDPITLARQYFDGADIVLVEGFTAAPIPKIEVFRRGVADVPLYQSSLSSASQWLAIVTDDEHLAADCPVLRFRDTMWLQLLANLGWEKAEKL